MGLTSWHLLNLVAEPNPCVKLPVSISYSSGKMLQNRSCRRRPVFTVRAGESVNEGIDRDLCSMYYVSVGTAVRHIVQLGQGSSDGKNQHPAGLQEYTSPS